MADQTITERLQPSLLDRLTDNQREVTQEPREEWVIDLRRLREIVLRDLSWLMNTTSSGNGVDPALFPQAARSVLCYGVASISGQSAGPARTAMLRQSIQRAIETFEPRLRAGSLDIQAGDPSASKGAQVVFNIRADIWAQPIPSELYLRTQIDMTTGEATVARTG
ncbi:type VI secretion system baseplate subunit TssE [Paracoccus sp. KR1-242]|uniref:type VI secretion system baseplate subunit TssE n=1 Tax=Paracoccus sp. KR1-242 TaxID=3410028 RepID=UPI003C075BD3